MKYYIILFVLIFLLAPSLAIADTIEKKAQEIDKLLIAPCCFSQPIATHESEAAKDMRLQVRDMLSKGMTKEQILNSFVAQYGERILAVPPPKGFNLTVYILPSVFVIVGIIVLVIVLRVWSDRKRSGDTSNSAVSVDPQLLARMKRELKERD